MINIHDVDIEDSCKIFDLTADQKIQEIVFYTKEDVGERPTLTALEVYQGALYPYFESINTVVKITDLIGFTAIYNTATLEIETVYQSFEQFVRADESEEGFTANKTGALALYHTHIQRCICTLYRLCNLFYKIHTANIYKKADKECKEFYIDYINEYLPQQETEEIRSLLFRNRESAQIFQILYTLNNIYTSPNICRTFNLAPEAPSITALGPPNKDGYAYLFHNHLFSNVVYTVNMTFTRCWGQLI